MKEHCKKHNLNHGQKYPSCVVAPLPEINGWAERLNNSKITGHISGRHLILASPKEDNHDDNEYSYLDEWIRNLLRRHSQEIKRRIKKEILEMENTNDDVWTGKEVKERILSILETEI